MASPNPLHRTTRLFHLPLAVLAALFVGPLVWMLATSLQPREQVSKIPPELLPNQYYVTLSGPERVYVTPPQPVGATDEVVVKEWLVSKYNAKTPRVFHVRRAEVGSEVRPVWGNYGEAIRALTAREQDKSRPLSELIGSSVFPWTEDGARGRSVRFLTCLANTLMVAVLGVTGTVLSSALVAYGLSRVAWRGRDTLFNVTLSTMMIPFPVLMIPLYSVFRALGWIGTSMPLW